MTSKSLSIGSFWLMVFVIIFSIFSITLKRSTQTHLKERESTMINFSNLLELYWTEWRFRSPLISLYTYMGEKFFLWFYVVTFHFLIFFAQFSIYQTYFFTEIFLKNFIFIILRNPIIKTSVETLKGSTSKNHV